MAARIAARYVCRRLSSGGKILSEEEKAAENIYIKKTEQEKLQKLAREGPKAESSTSSGGSTTDAKPSTAESASSTGVSSDKNRNYAAIAGVVVVAGAAGWYLRSNAKKSEVQN